jgi:hypothetical protein
MKKAKAGLGDKSIAIDSIPGNLHASEEESCNGHEQGTEGCLQ